MARSLTFTPDTETALAGAAAPTGAGARAVDRPFEDKVLFALFAIGIVGNVVLQKFAWPLAGGGFAPLVLPLFVGAIALTAVLVRPHFDPVRVGGFLLVFLVAAFSTLFLSVRYSTGSLMLFAALYLPFVIHYETSAANYRRCMDLFVTVMLAFVGVTLAQHVVQVLISFRAWPNLNLLVPAPFLVPDYNYIQPIIYGSRFMKPNGVAFLEVSLLSQYIAVALAIELAMFRRATRMVALTAGLLMTLAGTGALLMLLTLPVLLGRMRMRSAVIAIAALLIVCLIAFRLGWFDIVSSRMDEYKHNGSSANLRFIVPLERMIDFLHDPRGLIAGIGAGQIEKTRGFIWWPFTKVTIEYGLVSGLLFYAFLIYSLFRRAPDRAFAFVLLVWFSFEGTLITAHNVLSLVLFGTLLRIAPERGRALAQDAALPAVSPPADTPRRRAPPPPVEEVDVDGERTGEALLDLHAAPDSGGRLVYAIGDLHGRVDLFDRLMAMIRDDIAAHPGRGDERPMVVLLGDYVDRGPQSAQLIDRIVAMSADPSIEWRSVLGNHEDAMLAFLDARSSGKSWGRHGGFTTLASYGVAAPADDSTESWATAREELRAALPPAHEAWLRALEHYVVQGGLIFVHAGLRAGVPLEKQKLRDLLYIRDDFLGAPVDSPLLIVHGHTPRDEVYGARGRTGGRIGIDTGAYATGVLTAIRFDGARPALLATRGR